MRIRTLLIGGATAAFATPAAAQLRPLVDPPASAEAARDGVTVFLVNDGASALPNDGPASIDVVARDGSRLTLIAAPDEPATVQPGAFAKLHYRLAAAAPAVVEMAAAAPLPSPASAPTAVAAKTETVAVNSARSSSALLDRFRPYEPTYGAFGGGGEYGGKLQFSFAFRALGHDDGPRLNFGYTQTMLWAIEKPSGPIGPTTYSPEIFADLPIGRSLIVGGGFRHDSNGGGATDSFDANRIFVRATKSFDLGGGWRADVTPMAWALFGMYKASNLDRYWGYTSLTASIGQVNGLKLQAMVHGNPGTGKGSGELFISYPMSIVGLPGVYLFGQGFTGYGESLANFDRRDSHARIGIALTR